MSSNNETAPWRFQGGEVAAEIDLNAYRLTAIQKTAYRLASRCTAVLGPTDEKRISVRFVFPTGTAEAVALEVVRFFFQDLLDQELREKIGEETSGLRDLLIAHAFSRTRLPPADQ